MTMNVHFLSYFSYSKSVPQNILTRVDKDTGKEQTLQFQNITEHKAEL